MINKIKNTRLKEAIEYFLANNLLIKIKVQKWTDNEFLSIDIYSENQRIHTYYDNKKELKKDFKNLKKYLEYMKS